MEHSTPFEALTREQVDRVVAAVDGITPVYVYSEDYIVKQIQALKASFQAGREDQITIRYAVKALSNVSILKIFDREGIHFDCSSVYEVLRVIKAGIDPVKIEMVSQELTKAQLDLLRPMKGIERMQFVASSPHQLDLLLADDKFKSQVSGLRVNPGFGSGYHSKTVVAGPKYSFGIWHENLN